MNGYSESTESNTEELERLRRENDIMRKLIAEGDMQCLYCGLAKAEMAKCPSGFPGCGRADDMLIDAGKGSVSRDELTERNRLLVDIALSALCMKLNIENGFTPHLHALNRDLGAFIRRFGVLSDGKKKPEEKAAQTGN